LHTLVIFWVYKVEKTGKDRALQNDYLMHTCVENASREIDVDMEIPSVKYWISRGDQEWWNLYGAQFPQGFPGVLQSVLSTQRIPALPKSIRDAVRDKCIPYQSLAESVKASPDDIDFLLPVYCGAKWPEFLDPVYLLSMWNHGLYLDHLSECPKEVDRIASAMGESLAVMHWAVGIDAREVEFGIGGAPEPRIQRITANEIKNVVEALGSRDLLPSTFEYVTGGVQKPRPLTKLWMLDFDKCRKITKDEEGTKMAVEAFFATGPHYPRPNTKTEFEQKLWRSFKKAYLLQGKKVLWKATTNHCPFKPGPFDTELPQKFIDALVVKNYKRKMNMHHAT